MADALLVTGCYRSGTTVVEKILNMHREATVASQPFPILYFVSKERFDASIGIRRRYPLDHLFLEDAYGPDDLASFLDRDVLGADALDDFVRRMHDYREGLWTPAILDVLEGLQPGTFFEMHAQLRDRISRLFPKPNARFVGSKEVLVEEMALPLLAKGCRGVFVIRDPRAMIASLNFRVRDNLTGGMRPVLYSLRAWRKSVALTIAACVRGSGHRVRYEDLVRDQRGTLQGLTDFLGLEPYPDDAFAEGIRDQLGEPWRGNSSFADQRGISTTSLETWAERLPAPVQHFIEAVCEPEMRLLGYPLRASEAERERALAGYRDPFESIHASFPADYSRDPSRIAAERERLRLLHEGVRDPSKKRTWFITPEVYDALAAGRLPTP